MSSIRSILEKHMWGDYLLTGKPLEEEIDQALKEISELIDEAKPEWTFDDGHNDATWAYKKSADKFQSNLKELLK